MHPEDPIGLTSKNPERRSQSNLFFGSKEDGASSQMSLSSSELEDPISYLSKLEAALDASMVKKSKSGDNLEILVEGKVFCTVKIKRPEGEDDSEGKADIGVITIDMHSFDPTNLEHKKAMDAIANLKCDFIVEKCSNIEDARKLIEQFPGRLTFEYGEGKVEL